MKAPHVTWLRAFEASARHNSFSAAAEELNLTAAAVSQQIRLLEKQLGVRLFDRLPRGVALTDIGQAYALPVRKSFADLQQATEGLFARPQRRVVRVRASISWAALVLAPRLAEFRELHPEIDLRLSTFVWADRFEMDNSDVDIRWGYGDWADGVAERLVHEHAILVCHPTDALRLGCGQSAPDFSETCVHQVVGFESEWQRLSEHFNQALPARLTTARYDSSLLAVLAMISGGGAMILLESFARSFLESGQLVAPFSYRLPMNGAHYLVQPEGGSRRLDAQAFSRWASALYSS
ncbi:LysR family transcriptional regulator [Mesorhizobium sp. MSK_1335]|uniref:LysR family transcriptional regulator n=1 Tax=Mesorhizobium montanum TaxID=3072323 RepID=A0ABU4ZQC4_9HYPH|nr:LysR family transcriptional regulator [Mesorhizobium sp. MSK_1335]MDX8527613.1 LysR family transcriptional regulator [Mesorhizobium sp. MSK_1335]